MDIMLDGSGDMCITGKGDILLKESVAQKIRIRLLWFEKEWRWDPEQGLPYTDKLLVKNPDTDYFKSLIRKKIFEVPEVTEVRNISISYDNKTRKAVIAYTAVTDFETIREEVDIGCLIME